MADAAHKPDDPQGSCDWRALAIELVAKATARRVRWDLLDGKQASELVNELRNADTVQSMQTIIDHLPVAAVTPAEVDPTPDDREDAECADAVEVTGPVLMGKPVKLVDSGHWSRFHDVPDKDWKVWKFSHQGGGKMVRF